MLASTSSCAHFGICQTHWRAPILCQYGLKGREGVGIPNGAGWERAAATDRERHANQTLIELIAKAYRWQEQIESGEYPSLEDLAHAIGCDRTYIGRMLRLTSLAPDIIEAILRGDEPDGLSLEKLRKNLPVGWDEQRQCWQ